MIALAVFLSALAVAGCSDSLRPAAVALQQNDAARASALLNPLRVQCSQSSTFYELLGIAQELSGRSPAAEDAFRTAISLDQNSPRLLTEFGSVYLQNKKPADAAKVLEKALALDPSSIAAAKYLIAASVQLGAWQRASVLFEQIGAERALKISEDPILVLWFARTLIETNQAGRIDDLLTPQRPGMSPALLFSLGTLFAEHRLYAMAVQYLRQIPVEQVDDAVYFNLGLAYSHLRKFVDARRCYFQAIDLHPGHVDAYFRVGLDYASNGDARMSIPWFLRAHEQAPSRPDISYALAEQLVQLNYLDTAQEILVRAMAASPANSLLFVVDGDLKLARGDAAAAIDSYQKALTQEPRSVVALVGLAHAAISQGKDEQAYKFLRLALSNNPQDPSANGALGLIEVRQSRWESAFEHLSRAWAQDRSNFGVALGLARAYRSLNRPAEALQLLTSLRPTVQHSSAFHLELAQLYTQLHRTIDARTERDAVTRLEAQSAEVLHFDSPKTYVY